MTETWFSWSGARAMVRRKLRLSEHQAESVLVRIIPREVQARGRIGSSIAMDEIVEIRLFGADDLSVALKHKALWGGYVKRFEVVEKNAIEVCREDLEERSSEIRRQWDQAVRGTGNTPVGPGAPSPNEPNNPSSERTWDMFVDEVDRLIRIGVAGSATEAIRQLLDIEEWSAFRGTRRAVVENRAKTLLVRYRKTQRARANTARAKTRP